ncbi:MAG TPA: PhzF family phenazine biosynthesis protein [Roseiflexaceae bacterium]|nr:PhzF family phenazine biosynthesis protein [Roseiflexaceae bacterium]
MDMTLYQIDAFTERVFAGNPAAVCPLDAWQDDALLQRIAAENNLAETAFFVPEGDGYRLRWFTPTVEVDLCGHATLASAFVIFTELGYAGEAIRFQTRSGLLVVRRDGSRLVMDFPSRPPEPVEADPLVLPGLGAQPEELLASRDYFAVYPNEAAVRALRPDMALLGRIDRQGVIATAPGDEVDFVSRYFAPAAGVPEDPVTGSAHCTLIPYWSRRLGKTELRARQVSERGGELVCTDQGDRVTIAGSAVKYLTGTITV